MVDVESRQLAHDAGNLAGAVFAEWNIQSAFDSTLIVEIRGAGLDEHKT
jgi:hypothetical protein